MLGVPNVILVDVVAALPAGAANRSEAVRSCDAANTDGAAATATTRVNRLDMRAARRITDTSRVPTCVACPPDLIEFRREPRAGWVGSGRGRGREGTP